MNAVLWSWSRIGLVLALLLAAGGTLRAQQGDKAEQAAPSQSSNDAYTLHAAAHLVVLDVVITGAKGRTVPGLGQDIFRLFEDGKEQKLTHFEEHEPVDPALIEQEKAEIAARLPTNTFTNYEPFSGNAVTVLLFNELVPLPDYNLEPLRKRMIDVITKAPAETPFIVYQLDDQLRLVQGITTNRELVLATINDLWAKKHFPPGVPPTSELALARRKTFTEAAQQLSSGLDPSSGKKVVFTFTGGLREGMIPSNEWVDGKPLDVDPGLHSYLCGVMDTLEQGRVSIYRFYPDGSVLYGFGCDDYPTTIEDALNASSHYYTLYYTPTNADWNGKYRKFKVTLEGKGLHAQFRPGYYARPENVSGQPHVAVAANQPPPGLPVPADMGLGDGKFSPVVFTATVTPSATVAKDVEGAPATDGNLLSAKLRQQGYRTFKVRYAVAARELKLARELKPDATSSQVPYTVRMEVVAMVYNGAIALNQKSEQVYATFDGPDDPHIQNTQVTANLTLEVPEEGATWIRVVVRDVFADRAGELQIPLNKIVVPTN